MRGIQTFVSGRYARRAAFVIFLWGLLIIAALNFRSYPLEVDIPPLTGVNSRLLLQKRIIDSANGIALTSTTENILDLTPFVDNSPGMSEDRILEEVEKRLPSLPIVYWNKNKNYAMRLNKTCARMPSIYELEFNNIYWQSLQTSNGSFHFYGAYYDIRKNSRIGPTIRILGMINRIEPTVKTFCQIWFENLKEPAIVKTWEYKYIWNKKWGNYKQGIYQPYLIACQIPPKYQNLTPASVSVVEQACDNATNNLRVIYNKPENGKKKDFAVCVKGLDFLHDDLSVRLVEWIEMLSILGADKIFFYELQVHPNISKVLKHYEQLGKVQVTPLTLPGGQPNIPAFQHLYLTKKTNHKRQNEIIPYNDCLYKNLYTYEYIVLLDIDEVIMPLNVLTWRELMDIVIPKSLQIRNLTRASYNVRNVYFLDDLLHSHGWFKGVPKYMHMLQHVYRSRHFTKPNQYVKCFHNPERVLTLHNHFPLACLGSGCTSYPIDTTDAQLQHYRADCVKTLKKSCEQFRENSVMDTAIWRYKEKLIPRAMNTLKQLGFFSHYYSDINNNIINYNTSSRR
ncbi:uncharacterized protein LOC123300562 [Chrysoperla carnea]|uniref:uncharacterized protein LOC123300562 n=1 Tax=Chrysoperla carnea TaxID=189513 RepID=UPI001D066186|nr:uncharacterized protein LOC123300562 [Chrysoperla carnea]